MEEQQQYQLELQRQRLLQQQQVQQHQQQQQERLRVQQMQEQQQMQLQQLQEQQRRTQFMWQKQQQAMGPSVLPPPTPMHMRSPPGLIRSSARARQGDAPRSHSKVVVSLGSVGHPTGCKKPCPQGANCRAGASCRRRHFCSPEASPQHVPMQGPPQAGTVAPTAGAQESLSIGSMGHPYTCALGCKYFTKRGQCKDGDHCTRCHLCHWSRYNERTGR